jgi:hypothetical protein
MLVGLMDVVVRQARSGAAKALRRLLLNAHATGEAVQFTTANDAFEFAGGGEGLRSPGIFSPADMICVRKSGHPSGWPPAPERENGVRVMMVGTLFHQLLPHKFDFFQVNIVFKCYFLAR